MEREVEEGLVYYKFMRSKKKKKDRKEAPLLHRQ